MRGVVPAGEGRVVLLLFVAALLVYLPGSWWGLPSATAADRIQSVGVDDLTPLGPLAEIHNIIEPKPDRNLGYPLLHSFLCAGAYSPYLGYLWLTGGFASPSGEYPFGLADPVGSIHVLGLIARLLSVLLGAGTVAAAYLAARAVWNRRSAFCAAILALLVYPMFYYARTGNVDLPTLFFTVAAVAVYARAIAGELTPWRGWWLGIFAGAAVATKEPAAAAFLALPLVLILFHRRQSGAGFAERRFWMPLATGVLGSIAAYALGSGLIADSERYFAHIEFIRQRMQELEEGQVSFAYRAPFTLEGHLDLLARYAVLLARSLTLPGLLLAGAGLAVEARRGSRGLHLLWPAVTVVLVLFLSARADKMRYLMAAATILALFAGRAVALGSGSVYPAVRRATLILAVPALLLGGIRGLDLTRQMIWSSHSTAATWFETHASAGERVEYFGPVQKLPPLPMGVVAEPGLPYRGAMVPPRVDDAAAAEVLARWRVSPPDYVLFLPDYLGSETARFGGTCPPGVFEGLREDTARWRELPVFHTPRWPWPLARPALDYPVVNPPITLFVRSNR